MTRFLSETIAQLQAQFDEREAELKSQYEAARAAMEAEMARVAASARLGSLPPDHPPMVTVEEATAVVHSREHLAEQEISARDAEIARTRMQAEMDRRRIETEGQAAVLRTRNEVQEARLALEAAERRNSLTEASARTAVEQEKSQSHLMQRALQEQQGLMAEELSRAVAEQQAIRVENERLQAENVALRGRGPMPVPNPSGLTVGPTGEVSNSVMAQVLLDMGSSFKRLTKKTPHTSSVKLSKFESSRIKDEAASLWIERFERVAEDEGWLEDDTDLVNKMSPFLDDVSYLWLQNQPMDLRRASAWPAFKAKWRRRFGLSRDMAMAKLITREFGPNEDVRSFGESIRQLCLSTDQDCNGYFSCSKLVEGLPEKTRMQLRCEAFGPDSRKSYEDILERAVELDKIFNPVRSREVPKKAVMKEVEPAPKRGGGTPAEPQAAHKYETPAQVPTSYPSNQSGAQRSSRQESWRVWLSRRISRR